MSKRKSAASQKAPANKRVKNGAASAAKPQAPAGASEVDEMLKRAMEMQDDFDDDEEDGSEEDEGSSMSHDDVETIGNSEESAAESESDLEEDEEAAAVVLPVAESSKSAQARLTSVLRKSQPVSPSQPSQALSPLQEALSHLKSLIQAIPATLPESPLKAHKQLKHVVPYPPAIRASLKEVNWKVAFEPPQRLNVVGLWPVGAAVNTKEHGFNIDLALEMPSSLFTEKDVKDYRYFAKRSFYLSVLYSALAKDPATLKAFGPPLLNTSDDELRPHLQLKTSTYTIHIHPACPADLYAPTKLGPERNNIRLHTAAASATQEEGTAAARPTPLYNASLLADTLYFDDLELFGRCSLRSNHFADALRLAQLWTRSLSWSSGCTQFVLYALAYLVDVRDALSTGPSGLFGSTLEWLGREDWERPVGWKQGLDSAYAKSLAQDQKVFMHSSGRLNLLSELTEAELELMRVEANRALQILRRNTPASIDQLFPISSAQQTPIEAHFDSVTTITLSSAELKSLLDRTQPQNPDASARPRAALHQQLCADLRQALSNRIKALHTSPVSETMRVALLYQSGEATRLVDHGPSATDEAACAAFKAFWGDKSELRRFKDGSIVEACVWDAPSVLSRFTIPEQIVAYILSHRFHLDSSPEKNRLSTRSKPFHELVQEPAGWRQRLYQADPESKGFSSIMAAYEELSSSLRGLKDLPLSIKAVAPASDLLRYSSTFIPGARKTKQYFHLPESTSHIDAADVVITFEQSGKWPSDLQAIQKVKLAFLAKVAELLKRSLGAATQTSAAFDLADSSQSGHVSLEILMPVGFAFRLHVFYEPELALLGQASFDEPSLIAALQSCRKALVLRPKHHAAMASLVHQYGALSGTIRLVKRWSAAHLLSPHITMEQLELLCAQVFLHGDPPASPTRGFARVLHLLSTWHWHLEPLLVPVFTASRREGSALDASSLGRAVEFPQDKATQIQTSFAATRQNDPAFNVAPWFLATEEDLTGRWWTSPVKMIAGRVKDLAAASLQALKVGLDAKTLFTSPTDMYDFALRLKPGKSTRQHQSLHNPTPSTKTTSTPGAAQIPVDFNSATTFVQEAQAHLGDTAVLFIDNYGGTTVYGLFNPLLSDKARPWTSALDFPVKPANDEAEGGHKKGRKLMVKLDKAALLGDLARLSRGLVVSVQ